MVAVLLFEVDVKSEDDYNLRATCLPTEISLFYVVADLRAHNSIGACHQSFIHRFKSKIHLPLFLYSRYDSSIRALAPYWARLWIIMLLKPSHFNAHIGLCLTRTQCFEKKYSGEDSLYHCRPSI